MRCVVALMQHETNTFSPLPTTLADFAVNAGTSIPPSGERAIELYGNTDFAFAALLKAARQRGAGISVPVAAYAEPGGRVDDDAFEFICDCICDDVKHGCDAVLLDLHGAMVTGSFDDGEGELLRRIRRIDPEVPIAVALDFHTNLTSSMASNCTVIDGYRTYPHIDMYETGERAARSLFHIMDSGARTRNVWRTLPMMTHMINQTPLRQPMKDIMDRAIIAADSGEVLNVSVFGGFPLSDIPHVSFAALAVETDGCGNAQGLINDLCDLAWQRRGGFVFEAEPLEHSIARAGAFTDYPVVVADHGDNCGAGGSADDMTVLDEMLKQGLGNICAGPIWDPQAVNAMVAAGQGSPINLRIGGHVAVPAIGQSGHGLEVSGIVAGITDGRFIITGPMQTGLEVHLGRTAVLRNDKLDLVVSEQRWEPYDIGCFTHAGIDPTEKRFILIKSRQHFRAGFEAMARHVVLAAGPGVCSSNYDQFRFDKLTRPIFPLDPTTPAPAAVCRISVTDTPKRTL